MSSHNSRERCPRRRVWRSCSFCSFLPLVNSRHTAALVKRGDLTWVTSAGSSNWLSWKFDFTLDVILCCLAHTCTRAYPHSLSYPPPLVCFGVYVHTCNCALSRPCIFLVPTFLPPPSHPTPTSTQIFSYSPILTFNLVLSRQNGWSVCFPPSAFLFISSSIFVNVKTLLHSPTLSVRYDGDSTRSLFPWLTHPRTRPPTPPTLSTLVPLYTSTGPGSETVTHDRVWLASVLGAARCACRLFVPSIWLSQYRQSRAFSPPVYTHPISDIMFFSWGMQLSTERAPSSESNLPIRHSPLKRSDLSRPHLPPFSTLFRLYVCLSSIIEHKGVWGQRKEVKENSFYYKLLLFFIITHNTACNIKVFFLFNKTRNIANINL